MPQPGNPQTLNRFAYANNNPILFVDPTGHFTYNAIYDYLLNQYNGNEQAALEAITAWQNDSNWWTMISEAQAGDILFGGAAPILASNAGTGMLFQFDGVGRDQLFGGTMLGNETEWLSDISLTDIQRGFTLSRDEDATKLIEWVGLARESAGPYEIPATSSGHTASNYQSTWLERAMIKLPFVAASQLIPMAKVSKIWMLVSRGGRYVVSNSISDEALKFFRMSENDLQVHIGPSTFYYWGDPGVPWEFTSYSWSNAIPFPNALGPTAFCRIYFGAPRC